MIPPLVLGFMHMRRSQTASLRSSKITSGWSLYAVYYNWIKVHKALRVTPAMEAGLSAQVCTFEDLAMLIEAAQEKPGKRGPYKKALTA
jgi:hypothetical protein